MKLNISFYIVLTLGIMSCNKGIALPDSNNNTDTTNTDITELIININEKNQTIDGFAASDCWSGNYIGRDWEESQRTAIADLLFSQEIKNNNPVGIGLSMWRSNLGAGTANQGEASGIEDKSRRAECYLNEDGTYDWTLAAGQQYFLQQAIDRGCESIVLFSNSAPVWYTKNGKGYSNEGYSANLQDQYYDDFASYMTKVAMHYEENGIPIKYISPVNEPQYKWNNNSQEGSGWTNSQIAKLTKELNTSLEQSSLDTKILLSEANDYRALYEKTSNENSSDVINEFFDENSDNYIGNLSHVANIVGGHSYWTDSNWDQLGSIRRALWSAASAKNLKVYQTEWSMLGDGYNGSHFKGYDNSSYMDIAMYLSQVIHNDLAYANVSSWSYWTSMDVEKWNHKDRFLLVSLTPAGGVYGDISQSGTHVARKTLWVLGNYSRFIRPGYKRITIDTPLDKDCFGTAYISPDENTLVVIMTNFNSQTKKFSPSINNFNASSVYRYITSENFDLKQTVSNQSEWSIPSNSVCTFVLKK